MIDIKAVIAFIKSNAGESPQHLTKALEAHGFLADHERLDELERKNTTLGILLVKAERKVELLEAEQEETT